MNQPYRTVICTLATVALLSLSSCARNSTTTQSPNTQSDNLSVSRTNSSPSTTREADSKTFIAQNTINSRSPAQKIQQSHSTIPIVTTADTPGGFTATIFKPTYLPSGFFLTGFHALEHYYDEPNPFNYSIIYRERGKDTCLEIYDVLDGTSFEFFALSETSVNVLQSKVTVYSVNLEGRSMIVARFNGEQFGLPSSYYFTLISGYTDWCEPVSMEEFIKVLQSMKPLQ
jgi:hypothetical protein